MRRLNTPRSAALCLLVAFLACASSSRSQQPAGEAYSRLSEEEKQAPEWAVAGLDVASGLEAALFASEPMLVSPSNMDIDHLGRVWVLEVVNYRSSLNPSNPQRAAGDRILILEDTTGDGKADRQTVFYQGPEINAALGIAVLGSRVIVSTSPEVLIFTDKDGDDRADVKEVFFSGVGGEDHDHGVHAFVFGPDGKYYFNFGNSGKQILDRAGDVVVDMAGNRVEEGRTYRQGMVFRSNPDGSEFEVLAHNFRNNYEVAVDAFGTLWQSDNDDDGNRSVRINFVMEYGNYGYVDEITGAGWRSSRTNRETNIQDQHWHQNDPGVVPNLLHTGAGSPTGIIVYEGRLLPRVYWDQLIHADAGPNVVRAYPVQTEGAGYEASIVDVARGTRDRWFRPSDVAVAPDGSLFIADWHDSVVGGHEKADALGRGRIFRIAPPRTPYRVSRPDVTTAEGAADALKSPNLSTRALAWTTLHELQQEAEPALLALWQASDPRLRARALWLLTKIEGRGDHFVREALKDADANIRITGLRAARQLHLDLIPYVKEVVRDPSPQVRREAAIALRQLPSPEAAGVWAELALQHAGEDRWYLEALGIGADLQWDRFLEAWLERVGQNWNTPAGRDIVWRARGAAAMPLMAELIADAGTSRAEGMRYFRAFDFHEHPSKDSVLLSLLNKPHPEQSEIRALALKHVSSNNVANQPGVRTALEQTLASVRGTDLFVDLVARFDMRNRNDDLIQIVVDQPDSEIALEAVRQLLRLGGDASIERVLTQDGTESSVALVTALGRFEEARSKDILEGVVLDERRAPAVRRAAVHGLGRGWSGESRLLELLQEDRLSADLKPAAADVLLRASRGSVRNAAAQYLGTPGPEGGGERPAIQDLVARTGDPALGRTVFDRLCRSCHVANATGIDFGPELSAVGSKLPREALYLAVLDPDAGINFGYEGKLVRLRDGSQVAGIVTSETSDVIELRVQSGLIQRYNRVDVTSVTNLQHSLMPSNLYQQMTEQELIDLIEYLTTLRKEEP